MHSQGVTEHERHEALVGEVISALKGRGYDVRGEALGITRNIQVFMSPTEETSRAPVAQADALAARREKRLVVIECELSAAPKRSGGDLAVYLLARKIVAAGDSFPVGDGELDLLIVLEDLSDAGVKADQPRRKSRHSTSRGTPGTACSTPMSRSEASQSC